MRRGRRFAETVATGEGTVFVGGPVVGSLTQRELDSLP